MSRASNINEILFCFINFRKGIGRNSSSHMHELPHAQTEALFCIFHSKEVAVSELAKLLNVTTGAATQLVEALAQLGLVEREIDPADKRVTKLRLSTAGQKTVSNIKQRKLTKVAQVCSVLSDHELETFTELLKKVSESAQNQEGKHARKT